MYSKLNTLQLSQAIGKHRSTIHRMIKLGLPRNADKTFDLPTVIEWLLEREREALVDTTDPGPSPGLERFRLARAELAEIELQERREQLCPWTEIEKQWCQRAAIVAAGLDALAERLPPLLAGKKLLEMRPVIRRETDELRRAYARRGKYCPTDEALTDEAK